MNSCDERIEKLLREILKELRRIRKAVEAEETEDDDEL